MSLQFCGVNQRLDEIRKLEFLRPLSFSGRGTITGATNIETNILKAGPVSVSNSGDVTGVNRLHCTGQISSDAGLSLSEFSTLGKVQAGGPVIGSTGGGYVNFVGVGSMDADYGLNDPFYTRPYECLLPDGYPSKLYVWAINSDLCHLKITQGAYTYFYNFPLGLYTAHDLCSYFNNQLQLTNASPLLLSYDSLSDTFSITVDDSYGGVKEPSRPDVIPSYTQEFYLDSTSLLLQRMGFITASMARSGAGLQNLVSTSRELHSSYPSYFHVANGASQGYYFGGIKNDPLSEFWSPALNVWVGADNTQSSRYRVIKSKTDGRMAGGLPNEQVTVTTLGSDSLLAVDASITADIFDFNDAETPYRYSTTQSEERALVLRVAELSSSGAVLLTGTDTLPSYDPNDGVLLGPPLGGATLHLRSRNPKTTGVGPSLAFEGALANFNEADGTTTTPYCAIKAVPSSQMTSDDVDNTPGGQMVIMTTPQGQQVPKEALRVNESQQVCIGISSSAQSRSASSEKLYVCGDTVLGGSVSITGDVAIGGAIQLEGATISNLTVSGSITNNNYQRLESQVNAIITVLADNYEQISVVTSPEPSYSGINVTNVLKAAYITNPDSGRGTIVMNSATFTSANIDTLTVGDVTCTTASVDTLEVSTEVYGSLASFTSMAADEAVVQTLNVPVLLSCLSGAFTSAVVTNLSGGSVSLYGTLSAGAGISGTLLTPVQPNVTSLGTLVDLTVDNDVQATSASFSGICTALSGFSGTILSKEQPNITSLGTQTLLSAVEGNITTLTSTTTTSDELNVTTALTAPVAAITSIICSDVSVIGVASASSIAVDTLMSDVISATSGTFVGVCSSQGGFCGELLTSEQPNVTSLGTLSDLTVSATTTTTDLVASNTCTANGFVGTIMTPSQPWITNVGTLDSLDVSGTLNAASGTFAGICSAVTGFYGAVLSPHQTNITRLGTLESLTVAGNFQFGSAFTIDNVNMLVGVNTATPGCTLDVNGDAKISSSLSVSGVTTSNGGYRGILLTATQPNITGVGTLSSLRVSGITTTGSLSCSGNISGTLTTANQPNITALGTLAAGLNIASGQTYKINNSAVLSATTLGGLVTSSSLKTLGTLSSLSVSGVSSLAGDITFGNLSAWTPELTAASSHGSTGYVVLPGDICIQWSKNTNTSGTSTFTFPKAMAYLYHVSITPYGSSTQGSNFVVNVDLASFNGSSVSYDSAYGSTSKSPCLVMVIGRL